MTYIPDWIELNDFILVHFPEVHKATRYINGISIQYDIWLKIYLATNTHSQEKRL